MLRLVLTEFTLDAKALRFFLRRCPSLRSAEVTEPGLVSGACSGLASCSKLRALKLSLSLVPNIVNLGQVLKSCKQLRVLVLTSTSEYQVSLQYLTEELPRSCGIRELSFRRCSATWKDLEVLCKACPRLQELRLPKGYIDAGGPLSPPPLVPLGRLKQLRAVDLRGHSRAQKAKCWLTDDMHAMDLCAVVIFVFPLVATSRAGSSSDQLLFMMTSVYVTVQIPTACMASNIWWVIIANLGMVVGLLLRAPYSDSFDPGQCLHESTMTLVWLEICFGVSCVIIARGTQAFLKMNERQRIRYKRATTELDAATSLLQLTCDAVVELDEDLCLKDHSKELAGILLRKPDSSLAGRSFMEFVASSPEKVSVRQKLSDSACGAERVNESFANAFHTRLVDSCCSKFRTEVFHVSFRREDGEQCHLVGLRDFTDQESLARAHANRDGDARKRHGRFTSVDVRPQSPRSSDPNEVSRSHTISMIFDMDSQMVDAASPPVCSLIGLSLPELFPDSGHEVFQTVWSSVAPYLQTEGMEAVAHVLHRFDGLLVRWGPSLNEHIDGTVELIQLQRGGSCDYRLLLKCRGSPVGLSSTLPSNPGQSIGVLPGTPLFERGSFLNASCENSGGART
ncbi:unnamed protein product [Symbiodinium necroappetens]|uniref:PAS domain-containing protein n=1 Tax=Symbiodinium necroappetens TaxID=1628268 RepID=A0A812LM95_9DINO|nr:unnamed protein product [Symbiodinium necroappetens]